MKNIRWNMVLYTLLGIGALVGVVMLMSLVTVKARSQVCSSLRVVVEGKETFIDQHDISKLINDQFGRVIGKELIAIDVHRIEGALRKLPYVSNAEIFVDMDGTIQVSVQQREVVLRVINQNGNEFYVDTEGRKIPVTLKYVPHVLVANGHIGEGYGKALDSVNTKVVKDLVRVVEQVKGNELWENQIVQLYVNEAKDIEIIPRVGKEVLVIGSADSLANKLARLEVYYKNILPKAGTDAYERVNVKYSGQIVCERRGDWFIDSLQMKINMGN